MHRARRNSRRPFLAFVYGGGPRAPARTAPDDPALDHARGCLSRTRARCVQLRTLLRIQECPKPASHARARGTIRLLRFFALLLLPRARAMCKASARNVLSLRSEAKGCRCWKRDCLTLARTRVLLKEPRLGS